MKLKQGILCSFSLAFLLAGCSPSEALPTSSPSLSSSASSSTPVDSSLSGEELIRFYYPNQDYLVSPAGWFSASGTTITGFVADDTAAGQCVEIPSNFTAIGEYAFLHANAKNINSHDVQVRDIILPSTITSIGAYAFKNLQKLTHIEVPENSSLSFIGEGAFSFCYSLASFLIPSGVKEILPYTFYHCENLGATSYLRYAYGTSLTSTTVDLSNLPEQRYIYGVDTSSGSPVYSHSLPSITKIGEGAFGYCSTLRRFICPTNLDFIDNRAFANCTKLMAFYPNSKLRKIGDYCFSNDTSFQNDETIDPTNFPTGAVCDFSIAQCPYLDDVGVNIFQGCSTGTILPHFMAHEGSFYYAYNWALLFDGTSSGRDFTIRSNTIGIARDLLIRIPYNHVGSIYKDATSYHVDRGKCLTVSLPSSLVYASNNFIRESGDDYWSTNLSVLQNNLSGINGVTYSSFVQGTFLAVTIPSDNSHFQILDVSDAGTGDKKGATLNVGNFTGDYTYQHLVNYYIGYNPTDGTTRPEARLIASTRFAHWNANNTFSQAAVVAPSGAALFTSQTAYSSLTNYTVLGAQSGEGTECLFNGFVHAGDLMSVDGATGKNSTATTASYHFFSSNTEVSSLVFPAQGATFDYDAWFSYASATKYELSFTAQAISNGSPAADTLTFSAINGTSVVNSGSASIIQTGQKTYSCSFSFASSSVTGLRIVFSAKSAYIVNISTLSLTITYNGSTTASKSDSSFSNWTGSSGAAMAKWENEQATYCFPSSLRRIEDHAFEGRNFNILNHLFLASSLEYVGRDLFAGSILFQEKGIVRANLQSPSSAFDSRWSYYFAVISSASSSQGQSLATLMASSNIFFGSSVLLNGANLWGQL